MTAIANFRLTDYAGLQPAKGTFEAAADVLFYGGTIATQDANGRADEVTAGQHALGMVVADTDNRTTSPEGGAAGALNVEVRYGVNAWDYTGTAPQTGDIVYVVDNQTVSLDSSNGTRGIAGIVSEVRTDHLGVAQAFVFQGPVAIALAVNALSILYVTVATKTALKALTSAGRAEGMLAMVQADGSMWRYSTTSTAVEDTADELVQTPADAPSTGRWLRADKAFVMKIPIAFDTADGTAIETIPAGFALRLAGFPYWEVTTGFTGGSSSAIGVSTNISGYETGGDLLGGATGDVAATLVAGDVAGTLGGELDDNVGFQALLFTAASEIQFDAITSAFTAGAGFVCVPVVQVAT
jgi:hypothetical protein